ncbi:conjugative transposon protein TraK [Chitinophaga sp. CC14]|uniref:conjugative transposon protein TraK n=1 Tax=Chitinophaga sp. CC14 TaxID=3029199 RepID=UPI003B75DC9D
MQHLRNIDTAFKHVRLFTAVLAVAFACTCCYIEFESSRQIEKANQRVIVIAGGKAFQAMVGNRKDNIPVEMRDHISVFHQDFFNLSPDEKAIENNMRRALYLCDASAKQQYEDLLEKGYYQAIVTGNVSQEVTCDSIQLSASEPVSFKYYGKLIITRTSAISTRNLITSGYIRDLNERSDSNPHGFLIERWMIEENKDLYTRKR